MRFDVIIGNPPFQKNLGDKERTTVTGNLWSLFWIKSLTDWSKSKGKIALISPTGWLSPTDDLEGKNKIGRTGRLWDIFNSYTSYADVVNVAKHFTVGSTFGYVCVDKSGKDGLRFSDGATTKLGFLPISGMKDVLQKVDLKNNIGSIAKPKAEFRVKIPRTKVLSREMIEIEDGDAPAEDIGSMHLFVYVDSKKQAQKVQGIIQNSLVLLNKHCRWSGFLTNKVVMLLKYVD